MRGGQKYSESGKIGGDFACSARRRGAIDKWRRQAYSTRQTGPDPAFYHWTPQRRGLRAQGPSIILCAKKRSFQVPQRRGSPHSGEGKNGKDRLITAKRRGYGKFPVVGIQDLYKTDLQNSFRVIRIILRGVPSVVTQILSLT